MREHRGFRQRLFKLQLRLSRTQRGRKNLFQEVTSSLMNLSTRYLRYLRWQQSWGEEQKHSECPFKVSSVSKHQIRDYKPVKSRYCSLKRGVEGNIHQYDMMRVKRPWKHERVCFYHNTSSTDFKDRQFECSWPEQTSSYSQGQWTGHQTV